MTDCILLTRRQVAARAGVSVATIDRWRRAGLLRDCVFLAQPGSSPRYIGAKIEAWLQAGGGVLPYAGDRKFRKARAS